jgi:hypothetical protein
VAEQERIERLAIWFGHSANAFPDITWYEFAAATGSTLAIFSLVSQVFSPGFMQGDATAIRNAHFPWIQGLHMLIDYFIDRDKDRLGGDFHFCSCYADEERKADRFVHILADGAPCCQGRPKSRFHRMVCHGLLAMYPPTEYWTPTRACVQRPAESSEQVAGLRFFSLGSSDSTGVSSTESLIDSLFLRSSPPHKIFVDKRRTIVFK